IVLSRKAKSHPEIQGRDDLASGKYDSINGWIRIGNPYRALEHFDVPHALAGDAVNTAGEFEEHVGFEFGVHIIWQCRLVVLGDRLVTFGWPYGSARQRGTVQNENWLSISKFGRATEP